MKKFKLSSMPIETQLYLNSIFNNANASKKKEAFSYWICMFWICQFDKISEVQKKHYHNLSLYFLDKKNKYNFENNPKNLIVCDNHQQLSNEIFHSIYKSYFPQKKSLFSWFSKKK
jgi:hypothetical protein